MISCMGGSMMNDQMRNRLFNHSDMVDHILSLPVFIYFGRKYEICRSSPERLLYLFLKYTELQDLNFCA